MPVMTGLGSVTVKLTPLLVPKLFPIVNVWAPVLALSLIE
jgi:hypothetical protein